MELRTGRPIELDERGRRVDPAETGRVGHITIGLQLVEERARDRAAGRPLRQLNTVERRCILAAEAAALERSRPS